MSIWKLLQNKILKSEEPKPQEFNYPRFNEASDPWAEYFYAKTYIESIGQGVLKNHHGLKRDQFLAVAENFSAIKNTRSAIQLAGNFDLQHLRAIHKALFGTVFAWAGEPRAIHMLGKGGNDCFIHPNQFEAFSEKIFNELKVQDYLGQYKDSKEEFTSHLVDTYLNINQLHYFREGNGRAQNIFISKLAEKNNYKLDFASIAKDDDLQERFYSLFDELSIGNKQPLVDFFAERLVLNSEY